MSKSDGALPDNALVCRGGSCTAKRFENGSSVSLDEAGKLKNVSVNAAEDLTIKDLSRSIPNRQIGVTTVGDIRAAGGDVQSAPNSRNPAHCVMSGVTPSQAETLFTPTQRNPNV